MAVYVATVTEQRGAAPRVFEAASAHAAAEWCKTAMMLPSLPSAAFEVRYGLRNGARGRVLCVRYIRAAICRVSKRQEH